MSEERRRRPGLGTTAIHAGLQRPATDDVIPPVHRSAIGRFDTAARFGRVMDGTEPGLLYGRIWNPTVADAAAAVAALEGAESGLLTASGMAAIHAAVVAHTARGGRLVADRRLYGNTVSLFRDHVAGRLGVEVVLVDGRDLDAVRAACAPGVDVLYCETIANPGSSVANLPALAEAAHAGGGLLVVDATIGTPYLCRPLEHGADVVVHSATKFLNGHHDVLAGAVAGAEALLAPIAALLVDTGGIADPDAAWLLRRGLRTFALRVERQCASAQQLAEALAAHPSVLAVPYPGLPDHPDHGVARRVLHGGFGAVLPFVVEGGRAGGERVMDRVALIERTTSIGGVSTGLSHPASTSHRQLSAEELEAVGVPAGLLRLAVGCEDVADLLADLLDALG